MQVFMRRVSLMPIAYRSQNSFISRRILHIHSSVALKWTVPYCCFCYQLCPLFWASSMVYANINFVNNSRVHHHHWMKRVYGKHINIFRSIFVCTTCVNVYCKCTATHTSGYWLMRFKLHDYSDAAWQILCDRIEPTSSI